MKRALTILVAFWCLVLATLACTPAFASKRVALVVGNSMYTGSVTPLVNPKNDAEDVGAALKDQGFDVVIATDLNLVRFETALLRFKDAAQGADIGLFFYAGHAVQYNHENYLIPTEAAIEQPELLQKVTVTFDEVQDALKGVHGAQVMIFDSCRDNPFKTLSVSSRSMAPSRGLERVPIKSDDSVILFSTRANEVAQDGNGRNSPFSKALVDQLKQPGHQDLSSLLTKVAARVKDNTGGRQSPEVTMSISNSYYFDLVNDRIEWEAVKDSQDPKVLKAFIERFPASIFRSQAERMIDQFEGAEEQRRQEQRRQERQSICAYSRRLLEMGVTMRDQDGLERLIAGNACPELKPEIDRAIKEVAATIQQGRCRRSEEDLRRAVDTRDEVAINALRTDAAACPGLSDRLGQQLNALRAEHVCSDDAKRLDALRAMSGPNRIADIQHLGQVTSCDRVRDASNKLVASLRDEDDQAVRRADQVCSDDDKRLDALRAMPGPNRIADIQHLGQVTSCGRVRDAANKLVASLRDEDDQAVRRADQVCSDDDKRLDALRAMSGPNRITDIQHLGQATSCDRVRDAANKIVASLREEDKAARRAEQVCSDDDKRLDALRAMSGPNRIADIQHLVQVTSCGRVRDAANNLVASLREEDAKAAHDAEQARICGAEVKSLDKLVAQGLRSAVEALGRMHRCESLDVSTALARIDDLAAHTAETQRIVQAQRKLARLGCYAGPETGTIDPATQQAVASFWAVRHAGQPAPTTISHDLSSELDGLSDPICPSTTPAIVSTPASPLQSTPTISGAQANVGHEAGAATGIPHNDIKGQPTLIPKVRTWKGRKDTQVVKHALHAPAEAEAPIRQAHHRAPVEQIESPAPRYHRVYASPRQNPDPVPDHRARVDSLMSSAPRYHREPNSPRQKPEPLPAAPPAVSSMDSRGTF